MNKIKSTKGITLVALVVTIVILLILAGITINYVFSEGGLFDTASDSKNTWQNAQNSDLSALNDLNGMIGNLVNGTGSGGGTTDPDTPGTDDPNPPTPEAPVVADRSGAAEPNLDKIAQKTYVTWTLNSDGTEYVPNDAQTTQPDNWYDYENGKWANIKTTKENTKSDGTTETLEAYWVWIPRYEYKVPESTQTTATKIDVRFIGTDKKEGATGYTKQSDGTVKSSDGYTIHPAFTIAGNGGFGELDGIWVGKFEASSNTATPDSNYGGGEPSATNTLKVQVKPGVQSWRNISVKSIFTVCRNMTKEGEVLAGSTVDSHMMKNTEWGAVAILSQSKYGVYNPQSSTGETLGIGDSTKKVWNNPYGYGSGATIKTGYVGNSADATTDYSSMAAPSNVIEYNKIDKTKNLNGTKASTTGTVYGVYDMAGGSWEYVAGVLKGNSTDGSKDLEYAKSKFDISNQTRPEEVTEANFAKKYLDLYNYRTSSSNYDHYIIGDATVETKGWNGDYSIFVDSSYPVFVRGR